MHHLFKVLLLIILASFSLSLKAQGTHQAISLALSRANLPETLRLFAKFLDLSVIISPTVTGTITLSLREANPRAAFRTLLLVSHLAVWQKDNIWYIAPLAELTKRRQEEIAWQALSAADARSEMKTWQIHYAKAEDIAHMLQNEKATFLSQRGVLRVDTRASVIIIQDDNQHLALANTLIKRLDVPIAQIAIAARLVSMDHDQEKELGVDLAITPRHPLVDNSLGKLSDVSGQYSLAIAKLADGSLLDIKLSALEKTGHAEVISSPSLFTTNQQPASIEAGEEVPYQEVSEGGGTGVVFKKAVLGLKVTPQVLPGNKVLLQLQINQDRPTNKMVQGVPAISTRQMTTSVIVSNDQTIVLGGIYEASEEEGNKSVPFISQVPLLGRLFKQLTTRKNKRELLIFITPKIIVQKT